MYTDHGTEHQESSTASALRRSSTAAGHAIQQTISRTDYSTKPWGLKWRSNTLFIITTVGVGIFTDIFLYGLIVPVVPFMLVDRIGLPKSEVQSTTSMLLAVYAAASVAFSPIAGWLADKASSRQLPFMLGLVALLLSTVFFAAGQSVVVLAVARILQGLSGAVVWTIGLALCLETVGPERLGTVIGTIFSFVSVGTQAAPTIGGVLYDKTGVAGVFGIGIAILVVDFILRLFVIEKRVAERYEAFQTKVSPTNDSNGTAAEDMNDSAGAAGEETALLGLREQRQYSLPKEKSWIVQKIPILACMGDAALVSSLFLAFAQAFIFGSFDSTIPTVAEEYYHFNSLRAGLLFLASGVPDLVIGPLAGWSVDRFGTKPVATIGCLWLVPTLALLRLPQPDPIGGERSDQVKLWAALLALTGIGMGLFGAPAIVEAGAVVERYYKANPDFFGERGPYAQLYGLNSMSFNAGLVAGPLIAGQLKDTIGYGNMNAVMAGIAGVSAIVSLIFVGGRPLKTPKAHRDES